MSSAPSLRHLALVAALALAVLLAGACGGAAEPRRDLVLVFVPTPGTTLERGEPTDPDLAALRARATVYRGPQRHEGVSEGPPTAREQRVSVLNGTRHADSLEALRPGAHSAMWIAQRSGRQARAATTPTGLRAEDGFDDFRTKTNPFDLEVAADADALLAIWQGWAEALQLGPCCSSDAEHANAERHGATDSAAGAAKFDGPRGERAPALLVLDFGDQQPKPADLAAALRGLAPTADVVLHFTDPASADRLWLLGPGREAKVWHAPLDPREVFRFLLEAGRIQLPSTGQGMRFTE